MSDGYLIDTRQDGGEEETLPNLPPTPQTSARWLGGRALVRKQNNETKTNPNPGSDTVFEQVSHTLRPLPPARWSS